MNFQRKHLAMSLAFLGWGKNLLNRAFCPWDLNVHTIWHILGTLYQWAIIPAQDYSYHYLGRKHSAEMHKSILAELSGSVFFLHTYFVKNTHIF